MNKKTSTIIVIILGILLILSIPTLIDLLPKDIVENYGATIIIAPIVLVILVIIIAAFLLNKKTSNPLVQKRDVLLEELKVAEREYLKHKITKETFDSISREKNGDLIKVEAEIDSQKKQTLEKKDAKSLDNMSNDKRKVLSGLLEQKQNKVHELKLSEQSYLKRKIDETTYAKISSDIRKELVSIEAQINSLQKADEIEKIKDQLKEGAREIARQKKTSKERNLDEELNDEVIEQLNVR